MAVHGGGGSLRANVPELGRLLRAFREHGGRSVEEVEDRLFHLSRAHAGDAAWDDLGEWFRPTDRRASWSIAALEGGTGARRLGPGHLDALSEVYEAARLMLDSTLSECLPERRLVQSFDDFRAVVEPPYGYGAQYSVPPANLAGSDDAFVRLELKKGGESDTHSHPGDELLFVLEGTVKVELEGHLETLLGKGDYVHFPSTLTHTAKNAGESVSDMFILRCYDLSKRAASGDTFGRILKSVRSASFRGYDRSLDEISVRARGLRLPSGKTLPSGKASLSALESGQRKPQKQELLGWSKAYGLHPVVLRHWLSKEVTQAVVIHQQDLERLPTSVVSEPGVTYGVPDRRLAGSDVAVAILTLAPGATSPRNRHPGYELILVLEGDVEVRFDHRPYCPLSAAKKEYAHYLSASAHWIQNTGDTTAKLLVVRFHRDEPGVA